MTIGGIQKVSLIDYPGHIATVVFLRGCNFFCPYCHNPELIVPEGESLSEEDFFSHLVKNRKMLDGVCVSGGEPCVHPDLPEFLSKIKDLGLAVKLDTNGSEPEMLSFVISKGLVDYVAMDIKHSFEKYGEIVRREDWKTVSSLCLKSMDILKSSPVRHEFRTTVWKGVHFEDDICGIASLMTPQTKYFLQDLRLGKTLLPITEKTGPSAAELAEAVGKKYPHIAVSARN